jgi:hypothetical protein
MWYVLDRLSDGGLGETMAPIGIDLSDKLRRRSRRDSAAEGGATDVTDGCMERAEAARDAARIAGEEGGMAERRVRLPGTFGPFCCDDPGREWLGLGVGDCEDSLTLLCWYAEGARDGSDW